jgi:AAHS family benzoate transporter-like MFS transporter
MSSSPQTPVDQRRTYGPVTVLVLALCWITVVADGYDVVVFGAVVPALLQDPSWGLTPASVGLLGALAPVGMFVGSLVVGTVTDVVGRRRMLIGCTAWFSALTALCALAPNPEVFGLLRFLAGLGLGGVLPTATALAGEYAPMRVRNLAYGLIFTGFPLGGILAATIGIGLIPAWGWRSMFALAVLPLLVVVPIALRYLPESVAFLAAKGRVDEAERVVARHGLPVPPRPAEAPVDGVRAQRMFAPLAELVSRRYRLATACFWLTSFLCLFMIYGLNTWLPQIMRQAGYSLGSALTFLIVFNVGAIIGTVVIATAADRLGSKPVIVATFLLAAAAVTLLSLRLPVLVLYALVAVGGAGTIGTQAFINAYVSKHYPVAMSATALGWSLGVGRLGSVSAPPVLGLLVGSALGVGWNFYAIAVPGLLGAALILLVPRRPGDPAAPTPRPAPQHPAAGSPARH